MIEIIETSYEHNKSINTICKTLLIASDSLRLSSKRGSEVEGVVPSDLEEKEQSMYFSH